MDKRLEALMAALPKGMCRQHVSMAAYTSFKTGGCAELLVEPRTIEGLKSCLRAAKALDLPITILGRGSDILVSDRGIPGVTVRIGPAFSGIRKQDKTLYVKAGTSLAELSAYAAKSGLVGAEALCGIPGSLGGAVYMNAGAYEQSISDLLVSSSFLHLDGRQESLSAEAHNFGYRQSYYTSHRRIIVEAALELKEGSGAYQRMAELQAKRRASQPLSLGSGGSSFKRPPGHFAGKLISDAGLKGYRRGACGVSALHAGFLVNHGGASATEILALFKEVQARVFDQFGVCLEPEVQFVGDFGDLSWNC